MIAAIEAASIMELVLKSELVSKSFTTLLLVIGLYYSVKLLLIYQEKFINELKSGQDKLIVELNQERQGRLDAMNGHIQELTEHVRECDRDRQRLWEKLSK